MAEDECRWGNPGGCIPTPGDVIGGAAESGAAAVLEALAASIMEALGSVVTTFGTLWVQVDTPNVAQGSTPYQSAAGAGGVSTLLQWMMWLGLAVCIGSLLVAAARLAMPSRSPDDVATAGGRVGVVLVATIMISGAAALVGALFNGGVSPAGGAAGFIQSRTWTYVVLLAVASVIVAAVRMAWEQRAHPGRDLVRSLVTLVLVTAAAVPAIGIFVTAMDRFSEWILLAALDCPGDGLSGCFNQNLGALLVAQPGASVFLTIVLGFVALVTSLIQIVLLAARAGMLVVLTGVLPLTAAATNTEWGQTWFKRSLAWLVAFILYKPAAAIIYAAAFQMNSGPPGDLMQFLSGIMLMILAVVALPALMRLIAPAVGQMANGGSAGVAAAAAAVPAMGAISSMGRGAAAGGPSGADGSPGPTGAGLSSGGATSSGGGGGGGGMPPRSPAPTAPAVSSTGGGAATASAVKGAGVSAGAAAGPVGMVATQVAERGMKVAQGAIDSSAQQADDPQGAK